MPACPVLAGSVVCLELFECLPWAGESPQAGIESTDAVRGRLLSRGWPLPLGAAVVPVIGRLRGRRWRFLLDGHGGCLYDHQRAPGVGGCRLGGRPPHAGIAENPLPACGTASDAIGPRATVIASRVPTDARFHSAIPRRQSRGKVEQQSHPNQHRPEECLDHMVFRGLRPRLCSGILIRSGPEASVNRARAWQDGHRDDRGERGGGSR